METKITREELVLLVRALENREFKYSMIKDIHKYLLDKIDECEKPQHKKPVATGKEMTTKKDNIKKLIPAVDMFVD